MEVDDMDTRVRTLLEKSGLFSKHTRVLTAENVRVGNNYAFRLECESGHLDVSQWLYKMFELTVDDARAEDNWALRCSCINGHLHVAQWLCETFGLTTDDCWASPSVHINTGINVGYI